MQLVQEQTIREPISFSGVGLHSGAAVKMRVLPAPVGTGICFRRVDLEGFSIEAVGRNVAKVSYATSLMKRGVLISTTEHALSALMGTGIDNAIIELDQLELPILDGSAKPFLDAIHRVGIKRQRRQRVYWRITRPVEIVEGDKFLAVYPADHYSISYTIDFPRPIGLQTFDLDLTGDAYESQIAPARTFGFLRDEGALRNMGLIRGASEANAIVLTDAGVKNGPLRFPDEFVRHKILDLIGDLALLGHRILGKVVANRAGHAMHTALVSRLLRDHSLWDEAHVSYEETSRSLKEAEEAAPAFARS
ncbi:MAG: UDP-3-O-[3-hydroxymyristoyl] N-acetylglucosamine deacetylase [Acidobacteria bacterium]|nr:MAG: UDP-3-O-[3-hydroxymyristoyl] N-acetylglucosamine deacetylase [Acidobacteriota bacterium]PYY23282.1 MAG: UDP-3-O-[3-hydroxymyristoyl] N-acetylglucosamine deacetylase [Acidobacteriota bacterium]